MQVYWQYNVNQEHFYFMSLDFKEQTVNLAKFMHKIDSKIPTLFSKVHRRIFVLYIPDIDAFIISRTKENWLSDIIIFILPIICAY